MVTEIAIIDIQPGQEAAFVAAFRETGYDLLATTPGCISVKMHRSSETPSRFIGVNEWESKEAHLENFRGTDRYAKYGAALGGFLAAVPVVEHFSDIMEG